MRFRSSETCQDMYGCFRDEADLGRACALEACWRGVRGYGWDGKGGVDEGSSHPEGLSWRMLALFGKGVRNKHGHIT
jgi:hypothetical protein